MRKILVTGGAGYIGSHTVVELTAAGYTPIIVDNLCNTSTQNIEGIEIIYLDETDVIRHQVVKRIIDAYNNTEHTN